MYKSDYTENVDDRVGVTFPICRVDQSNPPLAIVVSDHSVYTTLNPDTENFGATAGSGREGDKRSLTVLS